MTFIEHLKQIRQEAISLSNTRLNAMASQAIVEALADPQQDQPVCRVIPFPSSGKMRQHE